jgi:DNA polymerase phi
LEKDTKHVEAIMDADDEIRRIRQSAQKTIGEITKLKSEKEDMVTGAEILLAFLILQTHDESDDALDLLEVSSVAMLLLGLELTSQETNNAVRQLFSLDPSSSSATESLPVDTVLDTLVALLDKNSSDLRNLANLVAGLISSAFTKSSIEHLNAVSPPPHSHLRY